MKIVVFVPTGEDGVPKKGDWYFTPELNRYILATENWQWATRPIVTRHEIEVPDGAETVRVSTSSTPPKLATWSAHHFDLPKPKKKVKRWRWAFQSVPDGDTTVTYMRFTEDEVRVNMPNCIFYHRIDETEIEEEEYI